jgi:hypothetical protein
MVLLVVLGVGALAGAFTGLNNGDGSDRFRDATMGAVGGMVIAIIIFGGITLVGSKGG